jgi:tRNA threonylcarbamoyladenosine biosynthesis protein TsaB
MKVLAIDTSGPGSAVAVASGEQVLAQDDSQGGERHGDVLLPRIELQLRAAGVALREIELIAVGLGPGSFTGLRVGLATAKGLALALGVPIRGVSSLELLARGVQDRAALAGALLDAGRGELYAGVYAFAAGAPLPEVALAPLRLPAADMLARLSELARARGPLVLCGSGASKHAAELKAALGERFMPAEPGCDTPRAGLLARAARAWLAAEGASDLAALEPSYLRDSDAKLPDQPLAL